MISIEENYSMQVEKSTIMLRYVWGAFKNLLSIFVQVIAFHVARLNLSEHLNALFVQEAYFSLQMICKVSLISQW